MGSKRHNDTTRTLADLRRAGIALRYSDTHTPEGHKRREPRPTPRRQGTRAAIVAAAMREA
jgi:hypothetical protein